jgi:hypothetical protein
VLGRKKKKRRLDGPPPQPVVPKVPFSVVLRMFVVGTVAVAAAAWAIWRHYSVPRMPMLVPAPSATEIPAPDLE